jgi:hypothetical protein
MPTFLQDALAEEAQRHKRRVAELNAAAAKLALLDKYRDGLAERGVVLQPHQLEYTSNYLGRVLHIQQLFSESAGDKLLAALLDLGFTEDAEGGHEYITFRTVLLRRGKLNLRFHCGPRAPAPATQAQAVPA